MPKAILEFNLDESCERYDFSLACKASDMARVLQEFKEELRRKIKYAEDGMNVDGLETAQKMLFELIDEYDIQAVFN